MMNLRLFRIVAASSVLLAWNLPAASSDDNAAVRAAAPEPYVPRVLRESNTPDTTLYTLPAVTVLKEGPRPILRHAKPDYPEQFEKDNVAFFQDRVNVWKASDAIALLGNPVRQRPSFDDDGKTNGVIYAYPDPLNRYKEFELDFDGASGKLRTAFIYPVQMSWRDCRLLYGSSVSTNKGGQGRMFYSYLNRRMDVLVNAGGNVVSLGIY